MHTQIEIYGYGNKLLGMFNKNTIGSLYHDEDNDTVKCFIFNEGDLYFENVSEVKSVTYVTAAEQLEIDEENKRTLESNQIFINNIRQGINPFQQQFNQFMPFGYRY